MLFQALPSEKRYLRIQDDELKGDTSSVDVATPENLNRLVQVGKALLKRSVCRVNVETGKTVPDDNRGTNEEELISFAHMLSQERKARLQKKEAGGSSPRPPSGSPAARVGPMPCTGAGRGGLCIGIEPGSSEGRLS